VTAKRITVLSSQPNTQLQCRQKH